MIHSGNWNDEIDVDGFVIMNKAQMTYIVKFLKKFDQPISISLGFGNSVDYENGREVLEEISFQEITNEEHEVIHKFFGNSNDFGDNFLLSLKESCELEGQEFKLCIKDS